MYCDQARIHKGLRGFPETGQSLKDKNLLIMLVIESQELLMGVCLFKFVANPFSSSFLNEMACHCHHRVES
jgi:hypothetical protein